MPSLIMQITKVEIQALSKTNRYDIMSNIKPYPSDDQIME
jgi:hypothetical protein